MKTYIAAGAILLMAATLPSMAQPPAATITGTPAPSQTDKDSQNKQVQKLLINPSAEQTLPAYPGEPANAQDALHGKATMPEGRDLPPSPPATAESPSPLKPVLPQCETPPVQDATEAEGAPCAMRLVVPF